MRCAFIPACANMRRSASWTLTELVCSDVPFVDFHRVNLELRAEVPCSKVFIRACPMHVYVLFLLVRSLYIGNSKASSCCRRSLHDCYLLLNPSEAYTPLHP